MNAAVPVNVDNFVRAETARMFNGTLGLTSGVNKFVHLREPTPIDQQTVIRMNRDTLYSGAIVDISEGADLTLPDSKGRYMTVMVVNEDHFVNSVLSGEGTYKLGMSDHGSEYVNLSVRTFVDPSNPEDVAEVNALQDAIELRASSARPYTHPLYDADSLDTTREALLKLAEGVPDTRGMFGKRKDVDPIRHLIGTAMGWGGLPETEAYYYSESEPRPIGRYTFTFRDVPVDAFWSLTVYNRDGYFEANPYDSFGKNSVTAVADADGVVRLNLAPEDDGSPNFVYIMDGWNYAIRLYKPRPQVLDGTWRPPRPVAEGS